MTDTGRYRDGVFVFRTLDDCSAIREYATGARRAAVIGGGLLGLEAARGLLQLDVEVHVVHLMRHLMEVQLDEVSGAMLRAAMDRLGVHTHLARRTSAVLGDAHVTGLMFDDGSRLECDMVVLSAGIRPNVAWPERPGLRSSAASSWATTCARPTTRRSSPSASARSTAGRSTGSWPRFGNRPRCSPTG